MSESWEGLKRVVARFVSLEKLKSASYLSLRDPLVSLIRSIIKSRGARMKKSRRRKSRVAIVEVSAGTSNRIRPRRVVVISRFRRLKINLSVHSESLRGNWGKGCVSKTDYS